MGDKIFTFIFFLLFISAIFLLLLWLIIGFVKADLHIVHWSIQLRCTALIVSIVFALCVTIKLWISDPE